ncbi:hypothetical protein KW429_11310 [Vibrio fluvialis]|nr:hypothetical protein [Vibrio fluvialis]MBY7902445.1 hypothetical protein [Vibrio fluvialis]
MRTLDHINFFHYVSKFYPVDTVINSKGSQYVSVFGDRKWYLVSKVMDTELDLVNDTKLTLVRVKGAFFLKVSLLIEGRKGYIHNFFPLNPHKLSELPLPSVDVLPTIELHYVSSLYSTLAKVVTLIPDDVTFTQELVEQFLDSRATTRSAEEFDRHANFFIWNGFLDGDEVFSCSAKIEKQTPVDNETEHTDFCSILDSALGMDNEALDRAESLAELMDDIES